MTKPVPTTSTPAPVPSTPSPAAGTPAAAANPQRNTTDDDRNNANRRAAKEKEKFKGTIELMHGHVFQLFKESRKPNQFTLTLEALCA
jgi:hypothetical protein